MKRGIIAVLIILGVTVSAIAVTLSLEHKVEKLYEIAASASDNKIKLSEFCEEWEKQIIYFELFTDHGYFEKIDKQIKKLSFLEGESYVTACKEIMIELNELNEHLSFSFGNIF